MAEKKYSEEKEGYESGEKRPDFSETSEREGMVAEDKESLYKSEKENVERQLEKTGERIKQVLTPGLRKTKKSKPSRQDSSDVDYHAKKIIKLDADEQVDHLVKVAVNRSPYLAIEIAKHLQNNYVLAELHSDLTEDKVRNILLEKGLL